MSVKQLVVDIVRLRPKNWQELASASRFLEGAYRDIHQDQAQAACKSHECGQVEKLTSTLSTLSNYTELYNTASQIRLGARAAALENLVGDFSDNTAVFNRMIDTMFSGSVIQHFVISVRSITLLNGVLTAITSLSTTELESAVTTAARAIEEYRANEIVGMFDMPQTIKMRFDVMSNVLQQQIAPDTVFAIVEEEIGIPLPEPVAAQMRAALNPVEAFGL